MVISFLAIHLQKLLHQNHITSLTFRKQVLCWSVGWFVQF